MLDEYIRRYRRAGILLDTNLLLFVLLASYDLKFAETYKRTGHTCTVGQGSLGSGLAITHSLLASPSVLGAGSPSHNALPNTPRSRATDSHAPGTPKRCFDRRSLLGSSPASAGSLSLARGGSLSVLALAAN